MGETLIAKVVIDKATYRFDKPFDYIVPKDLVSDLKVGARVTVPFGKGNTKRQGLVIEITKSEEYEPTGYKRIATLIDNPPLINDEMLRVIKWLKANTFCTYFDAVKTLLPFGLNLKIVSTVCLEENLSPYILADLSTEASQVVELARKNGGTIARSAAAKKLGILEDAPCFNELIAKGVTKTDEVAKRNMKDPTVKMVSIGDGYEEGIKLSPKQQSVVNLLLDIGTANVKEVCYFAGVTTAVIGALQKKGLVNLFDAPIISSVVPSNEQPKPKKINLTKEQEEAFISLKSDLEKSEYKTNLLYGVTGSGKTSVFLCLVDEALKCGKSAIVTVPEIALTPQTLSKFRNRYGDKVAVFHSAMSLGQRMEYWKMAKSGKATVAIGTRSAVFAPMENLGLIIMDEEQEHTYKSEQSPRFHAREVAKLRAKYNGAMLLLASATPSVESYTYAKNGKYGLLNLPHRFGNAVLPEVITVDMRREMESGNTSIFSRILVDEISKTLDDNKQAILLLNRRGHNTYISCPSCGTVFNCPNCSISLTYHSANKRLMCHYCGGSYSVPDKCPTCSNPKLRFSGAGTQRADEELAAIFPKARILRLDADTTMSRDAFEKGLTAFSKNEYDILLGTQMVAKGLDFPNVTLVGVLSADQSMFSDDFRAFERTFSLLTQVIGRSGRGDSPGKAIIQTTIPESELISFAEKQDFDSFYNTEIMTRKLMIYPPYCDIFMIGVSAAGQNLTQFEAKRLFSLIKEIPNQSDNKIKMIILGPTPAQVPRVNNKYRYRILIKTKNSAEFREYMSKALIAFYENADKSVSVFVDVNPESII